MLSFKTGVPIIELTRGKYHGRKLRIHDGTKANDDYEYEIDKLRDFDDDQLSLIKEALLKADPKYLSGKLKQVYNKIVNG